MKRYVVTGAPVAGKTSIVRELERMGHAVVAEAATDVIAAAQALGNDEPWTDPGFVDEIVAVQRQRQQASPASGAAVQLYDRSPICTLALTWYLDRPVTDLEVLRPDESHTHRYLARTRADRPAGGGAAARPATFGLSSAPTTKVTLRHSDLARNVPSRQN